MGGTVKKKVDISFTNWVLGGSLVSIATEKTDDKGLVKKVRHSRKVFIMNEDGTTEEIDAEDVEVKAPTPCKGHTKSTRVKVEVSEHAAAKKADKEKKGDDTKVKDGEKKGRDAKAKDDEKKTTKKLEEPDTKGEKWCKICKIPDVNGTEDTRPEGACYAHCDVCGHAHWISQNKEKYAEKKGGDNKDEAKKGDTKKADDKQVDDMKPDEKKGGGKKGNEKNGGGKKDADKESEDKKSDDSDNNGWDMGGWGMNNDDDEKENKKDEGMKDEDKKDNDENISPVPSKDGTKWTNDQDEAILTMKSDSKTWNQIASAVGASKSAVQTRHKELQAYADEYVTAKAKGEDWATQNGDKKDGNKKKDDKKEEVDPFLAGLDQVLRSLESNYSTDRVFGNTNNSPKKDNKETDKGGGAGKKTKKQGGGGDFDNQNTPEQSPTKASSGGDVNDNNAFTYTSYGGNGGYGFSSPVPDFSGPQLYGKLKIDGTWNKDDCDLLEYLYERHESEKWLHMQAQFYNYTGRMVAAEFIEKKFKHDGAV
ncbi:uncharacterized protein PAC_08994 [Phialocephala subalpina]|uniref:Myb-like domain-containing protein n=1 Tax=Phialocephala subalpina TaxID=576137 RepID=A0A1L7X252_9HELO|nr:uncharacterized protein PAC_08994 [Phialocephala subalpina]